MKFYVFGLLLCITTSIHGNNEATFNGHQCFIGGYQHFPGIGIYKLYTVSANWNDARKLCRNDGAHLVVINSREEYETVRKMQKAVTTDHIYIGIHDLYEEGNYVTVTGDDFVTSDYLKWDAGQPDNAHNNEDCIMLKDNGLLNDIACSKAYYFICEHTQNPSFPLIPRQK